MNHDQNVFDLTKHLKTFLIQFEGTLQFVEESDAENHSGWHPVRGRFRGGDDDTQNHIVNRVCAIVNLVIIASTVITRSL